MRILALDTALNACAASIFDIAHGEIAGESVAMSRGHAEALIPLVARIAEKAGGLGTLNRIVTTVGPGSFTGLRVGISAARGFALALKIPCVGVTTLAAIAARHIDERDNKAVAAAIDARHGTIYFQLFSARGRTMVDARALPIRDAARLLGGGTVKLAGPAAPLLLKEARAAGASCVIVDEGPAPDIRWVAKLGIVASPDGSRPRPLYLKPADATPQQNGRVART